MSFRLLIVVAILMAAAFAFLWLWPIERIPDRVAVGEINHTIHTVATALPPVLQVQGPTAPERAREMALAARQQEQPLPENYLPGQHVVRADDPRVHRPGDGSVHYLTSIELATGLNDPETSPARDLEIMSEVVGFYRAIYRQNPVAGLNHEVTAVLTGKNGKNIVLVDPADPAINALGELTDRWGTPYHFHGISSQVMEFVSAGPDQKFGTADDLRAGDSS